MALAPAGLLALGLQPPLELHDDLVDRREVLQWPAGKRPVELVQRSGGGQRARALDLCPLELAAEHRLELADLLARQALRAWVLRRQLGLRLRLQAQRPADPLDVHADHARAVALATEGGDGQAREILHPRLVPVAEGLGDHLADELHVELAVALPVAGLALAGCSVLVAIRAFAPCPLFPDALLERSDLGRTEEEAVEDELERPSGVRGLRQGGGERLTEVRAVRPGDELEHREGVEQLARAHGDALAP